MKRFCRNLAYFVNIICNLAVVVEGIRDFLVGYTLHSLLHCCGLLTALVVLNSVVRWCDTTSGGFRVGGAPGKTKMGHSGDVNIIRQP